MEKEELFSTLKSKIGNTNLSDRSLMTYVENNLPADGTEPDDAYWQKHTNIVNSLAGQLRADISKGLADALPQEVVRWLEKNPKYIEDYIAKQNKPSDPPTPPNGDNEVLKQLLNEINSLKQAQADQIKEQKLSVLRSEASKLIETRGIEVNSGLWEDSINAVSIPDGATSEDVFNLAKALYEDKCKKYSFDGGKPFSPNNLGGGSKTDKTMEAFFAKKKAKMGIK